MSELNRSFPIVAFALAFGALLFQSTSVQAADFQVAVTRNSVPQCSLTGSLLNIDPTTGSISIDLSADFTCYPLVVSTIANGASLSVTGPTTVGGGTTGAGTINLQLNTGLSAATPGVTCVPDGFTSSNVSVSNGWSAALCSNNCGATVTRSVDVQNPSATLDGNITFKAKCTYQDQSNVNLSSVRANIQSAPSVTVQHGTTPPPAYCQSVSELADPKGLTPAMRQATGNVTGGTLPGTGISFLNYTSVFGVSANTYPAGTTDTAGYGFPGTNFSTLTSAIQKDKYVSLQFRAPTNSLWNLKTGFYYMTVPPNLELTAAIAPCPGQFDDDVNFPLGGFSCKGQALVQDITWKVTSGTTASCDLIPGNTYYLNLIHASRATPAQSVCGGSSCSFQIQNSVN